MSKMNKGAMTNLRHILYDVFGNFIVYFICYFIFFVFFNRHNISAVNTFISACLYTSVFVLYASSAKLYDSTTFYYADRVVRTVILGCIFATTAVSTSFYFSGRAQANRSFYLAYFILSLAIHLIACYLSFVQNRKISGSMHSLLIGEKENFYKLRDHISKTNISFSRAGNVSLSSRAKQSVSDAKYLGYVEDGDLDKILQDLAIDQVYIMREPGKSEAVQKCINTCLELGIVTRVVFPVEHSSCDSYVSSLGNYPIVSYHMGSLNICSKAIKRIMDIIGSCVGMVLLSPVFILSAIAIKLDSPGSVLFSQIRVGLNGRRFKIYKLRTMTTDAEYRKQELLALNEMQGSFMFKMKEDPRVTKIGNFLRKTSIDEIPQFFNVLMGNMSLVGTRPPTENEVQKYELNHWRRLRTKPGITGMWQISGRNKITEFDEVVHLDTEYIQNWNLLLDIKILFKTFAVIFKKTGAS